MGGVNLEIKDCADLREETVVEEKKAISEFTNEELLAELKKRLG